MLPSPNSRGLGLRGHDFRGHLCVHIRYGPMTRCHPMGGSSMGFRASVSLLPAIQATELLALAPAGLSPAERASLCWTHDHVSRFRTNGTPARFPGLDRQFSAPFVLDRVFTPGRGSIGNKFLGSSPFESRCDGCKRRRNHNRSVCFRMFSRSPRSIPTVCWRPPARAPLPGLGGGLEGGTFPTPVAGKRPDSAPPRGAVSVLVRRLRLQTTVLESLNPSGLEVVKNGTCWIVPIWLARSTP